MKINRFFKIGNYKKYFKLLNGNFSINSVTKAYNVIHTKGISAFVVKLRAKANKQYADKNSIRTKPTYEQWIVTQMPSIDEIKVQRGTTFTYQPLISIVVPTFNTDRTFLKEMIESVIAQSYSNWELCIADGSSNDEVYYALKGFAKQDSRVHINKLDKNHGIVGNSNAAIAMAQGEYVALLDHDDIIYPHSLYEVVKKLNDNKRADIIYTDEDKLSPQGKRQEPFFKPDWSPDLLKAQMYIGHLFVIKRELLDKIKGFREGMDGAQDYDLMLRLVEQTNNIQHLQQILYSWRETATSTSINPGAKPYAHDAGKKALNDYLKAHNGWAEDSDNLFVYDARYKVVEEEHKASIIIPIKDNTQLTKACIDSIETLTTYKNYEIIIINNNSVEEKTLEYLKKVVKNYSNIRVVDASCKFNWSKLNNIGIQEAQGDVLVFLNNDTKIIDSDWLMRFVENSLRPDIGIVGGLLLYEDRTIQHAGVVVGMGGWADHIFKGMQSVHYGSPFISPMVRRNVLAVTGACMAISRFTLNKIGEFNENFIICGSDVEICLRAFQHGLYNVYIPEVRLIHYESKSRDAYIPNIDFELSKKFYGPYLVAGDPFFNKNLNIFSVKPEVKW